MRWLRIPLRRVHRCHYVPTRNMYAHTQHCIYQDAPLLHAICGPPAAARARQWGAGPGGDGRAAALLRACASTRSSLCGMWPAAVWLRAAERLGWATTLAAYAPSDLYTATRGINGFAAFAAWGDVI